MKMAKSSPKGEKTLWISPFPTVFSKDFYCRHVKTRVCLGKGLYFVLTISKTQRNTDFLLCKLGTKSKVPIYGLHSSGSINQEKYSISISRTI